MRNIISTISFLLFSVISASAFTVPPHAASKSEYPIVKHKLASQTAPKGSDAQAEHDEDDWHPEDPACTTPQFLCALWHMIAQGSNMVKGVCDVWCNSVVESVIVANDREFRYAFVQLILSIDFSVSLIFLTGRTNSTLSPNGGTIHTTVP